MTKPPLLVRGMHGLGDNIHQRAIVRQLKERYRVFLESSWVSLYHDLIDDDLKILFAPISLRTQTKNSTRERALFSHRTREPMKSLAVWYTNVPQYGSVLGAMCATVGCDIARADFRLPIKPEWRAQARTYIEQWKPTKPIMIYRPLMQRREWSGCAARNPDHAHYSDLFESIRDRFFVVSVADLLTNTEWLVGKPFKADVELHSGELEFEALAAMFEAAALTFTSPGFAVPLSQAVGTPVVCTFGGYENSISFSAGAKFTPYLGIDPIKPCDNWRHDNMWPKNIDMPMALEKLETFVNEIAASPKGLPEYPADQLARA